MGQGQAVGWLVEDYIETSLRVRIVMNTIIYACKYAIRISRARKAVSNKRGIDKKSRLIPLRYATQIPPMMVFTRTCPVIMLIANLNPKLIILNT